VRAELAGPHETVYGFGGEGDDDGSGAIDCSGYVNRVLKRAAPRSFAALAELRRRPRAREYVERIERGGDGWQRIARVADLLPGDVIAWRYEPGHSSKDPRATGHVVVVVDAPEPAGPEMWRVRVSDSARSGHSYDTRPKGTSGVGAGTMLVAVDSNGGPVATAWSLRGHFDTDETIAMGRPID
jgi:hypothetical protein